METRGLFPRCLPKVGGATPRRAPDPYLFLQTCAGESRVRLLNESLWKSRFMHGNLVRLRWTKIKERRGSIPRILEMFGELRLSLFSRYFPFLFTFVFLDHLFPFSKKRPLPSQINYITAHIRCLLYFISNRTPAFVDSCLKLSRTQPERLWEWRVRMRAAEAGEGAAVSSSTVPAGEAALR